MKRRVVFVVLSYFMLSIAVKAQSGNPVSHPNVPGIPGNIQQSSLHAASSAPHKATPGALIPLYDSIVSFEDFRGRVSKDCDFIYDPNNNLISYIIQEMGSNGWVNSSFYSYTYDADNSETSEVVENWSNNVLTKSTQNLYTYNANNLEVSEVDQVWSNNAWVNATQYLLAYNSSGKDTGELVQKWNGSAWVNYTLDVDTCNAMSSVISHAHMVWNLNSQAWDNSSLNSYTYNVRNEQVTEVDRAWKNNTWASQDSIWYYYNANNLLDSSVENNNSNNNVWGPYQILDYSYNAQNLLVFEPQFVIIGANWWEVAYISHRYDNNGILTETTDFYGTPSQWDSTCYYFNETVQGINEITSNNILIYPNPNKGNFTIENKDGKLDSCVLEIYNVLGGKVYQSQLPEFSSSVSISLDVPKGIYILRAISGQTIMNSKIVVQ